ncbi:MAG: hypothetical protein H6825_08975 [Planctomycetes bacterium]|nr:hypothetical protein [Planctomycetota bacterium]
MKACRPSLRGLALAALALASCAPDAAPPAPAPDELPAHLADTGLYADATLRDVAPDVWPYDPQYPLWTDGATKRRWIHVPAGSAIDATDPEAWVFPAGTRLWKEFALGRRLETRYMEKRADGSWLRASYVWSDDGGDAVLAPAGGVAHLAEVAPGVPYDVPGRADCATCHSRGDGVLGFDALQLSAERDPLAPHANAGVPAGQDLAAFVARGLVRGLPADLLARPPRIPARTPRERAALGYLDTHCGSCHRDDGPLAGLGLTLGAELRDRDGDHPPRALVTTVGRPSRFRPPGAPSCEARIEPGAPELSTLVERMATRDPLRQMPPLGTHLVDVDALHLIETWIREDLEPTP